MASCQGSSIGALNTITNECIGWEIFLTSFFIVHVQYIKFCHELQVAVSAIITLIKRLQKDLFLVFFTTLKMLGP